MAGRDAANRTAAAKAQAAIPRYRRESPDTLIAQLTGGVAGGDDDAFERQAFASILGGAKRGGGLAIGSSLIPTGVRRVKSIAGGAGPELVWKPKSSAAAASNVGSTTKPAAATTSATQEELSEQRSLVTSVVQRLGVLERSQAAMRGELVAKDETILKLRREIADLRTAAAGDGLDGSATLEEENRALRAERDSLRRQMADMESFLNDYGLVWVGSKGDGSGGDVASTGYSGFDLALDFGVLAARVRELNGLASAKDGGKRVVTRGGVSRLEEAETVPFTVWRDGFMLWRGPFRPASSDEAQTFLRDVLDGYFPAELRRSYPDGVQFKLIDRTSEGYDGSAAAGPAGVARAGAGAGAGAGGSGAAVSAAAFPGEGKPLGGEERSAPSEARGSGRSGGGAGGGQVTTLADVGGRDLALGGPIGREAFLARLPETTMKNGRVIKVREGVGTMMGVNAAERPDVVIARTPVVDAIRGDGGDGADTIAPAASPGAADAMAETFRGAPAGADNGPPDANGPVTTLQVRSDSGRQTLVVKLRYTDTVGDLLEYVNRYRAKEGSFELVTAFPRRAYTDVEQTLQDAGLVPNAKLMIRAATGSE